MEQLESPQQIHEQQNLLARYGRRAMALGASVLTFAGAGLVGRDYAHPVSADAAGITETSSSFPNANESTVEDFQYPATAAECRQAALHLFTSGGGYRFANAKHNKLRWTFDKDTYDPNACKQFGSVAVTGYGTYDSRKDHHGHGSHWRRNTPKYTFMVDPVGGVTMPDGKSHVVYTRTTKLSQPMRTSLNRYYYGSRLISTWKPADGSTPTRRIQRMEGASE
jgi:hypothetical protein